MTKTGKMFTLGRFDWRRARLAAYTITEYPDGAMETNIWKKRDQGWRIVHLHKSSVSQSGPPAN